MPRGVQHSAELRAQVIAAILAGASISAAAKQFGIDKGLASRWFASDATVATAQRARERDPQTLEALIYDLVAQHLATLQLQLQAATSADWIEKQSAAELAQLVIAERDTLLRLLAGFRPAEQPALGEPMDSTVQP
jgi:transposase-like protein